MLDEFEFAMEMAEMDVTNEAISGSRIRPPAPPRPGMLGKAVNTAKANPIKTAAVVAGIGMLGKRAYDLYQQKKANDRDRMIYDHINSTF